MSLRFLLPAFVLLMFVTGHDATAQKTVWHRLGLWAGNAWNQHTGQFRPMPYVNSCCAEYDNALDQAFHFGPVLEWAIGPTSLIGARMGYTRLDATFTADQSVRMLINGEQVPGTLQHSFNAVMDAVPLMVYFKQKVVGPLFLSAGPMVTFIPNPHFESSERIVSPSDAAYFRNGVGNVNTTRRNVARGDLLESSSFFGINATLQVEIPLDKERLLLLIPEINGTYSLNNLAGVTWKIHTYRAGFAFMWQYGQLFDEGPAPKPRKSTPADEGDVR